MSGAALLVGCEWLPNRAGGLNRYFHGLAHAASAANVRVHGLVTYLRPGQSAPISLQPMADEGAGLRARLAGVRRCVLDAFRDGVALANPHFALYAWPWVRAIPEGVPLVVNFHGPWADEMLAEDRRGACRLKAAAARVLEKQVYRRADRLITLSEAFAAVASLRYGVPRDRMEVVPGGVDLRPYIATPLHSRQAHRRQLGWPADRRIVLCVRRLAARMGIENLVRAAADVVAAAPDTLVLIGGRGRIESELQRRIDALGLQQNVKLLGFIPDDMLAHAYAAADITVLPTVALEGFGLSAVESLASGTPVIGTPVGGIPEVLSELSPSLLTAGCSASDLAQKLSDALAGRLALPSHEDCRRHALRFGWEVVWPQIRRIWTEAGSACSGREPKS